MTSPIADLPDEHHDDDKGGAARDVEDELLTSDLHKNKDFQLISVPKGNVRERER